MPPDHPLDLLQGTLDLLILKALSLEPMHGWAISERLHDVSRATLQVPQGSLYPALHRLEKRGLLHATWGLSENNRRARFYQITARGREELRREASSWSAFAAAVAKVLGGTERPEWA